MRHKRLENNMAPGPQVGEMSSFQICFSYNLRPCDCDGFPIIHIDPSQMVKNGMYSGAGEPQFAGPIRHPPRGSSVAQEITQNVMAQSRSINESMASLNMPRGTKNMPMTTPQPTPLGQSPQQVQCVQVYMRTIEYSTFKGLTQAGSQTKMRQIASFSEF